MADSNESMGMNTTLYIRELEDKLEDSIACLKMCLNAITSTNIKSEDTMYCPRIGPAFVVYLENKLKSLCTGQENG